MLHSAVMAQAKSYDGSTRAAVKRWALRGWEVPKIAEKVGITPRAVYYHLHRLEESGEVVDVVKVYRGTKRSA